MNYFAHGYRYIDRPYFLAGTAVPDWLRVSDPRVRVRPPRALAAGAAGMGAESLEAGLSEAPPAAASPPLAEAASVAQIAAGIARHHADDAWFHATPAFVELSGVVARMVRGALGHDEGLRCWFLGHILVELLLDAELISAEPQRLEAYYAALEEIEGELVQRAVNQMAPRRAERLAAFITVFLRERFLFDYTDDGKLAFRVEQVLRRAGLPPAGPALRDVLPAARCLVSHRAAELLTPGPPGQPTPPHAT